MSPAEAAHLQLLKLIERAPDFSQRELARELGVSLGKAHYLLRALVGKGWVKANNFRRNDSQSAYAYLLTPAGIGEKIRQSKKFEPETEAQLKAAIAEFKGQFTAKK